MQDSRASEAPTTPPTTTTVRVQAAALSALRRAVLHRHGKLHGALLEEVSAALRERAVQISMRGPHHPEDRP
ncbi:MAG TPA: hypothetical protein VNZ52_03975 [Candidatus Thermoplasmatota archaeon]|nr:hypothetical protein [Candidatus Thermoplasmatota archaeon]